MATSNNSGRDGQTGIARKLFVLIEALGIEGAYVSKKEVERRLGLSPEEADRLFYLLLSTDLGDYRPLPVVSDNSFSYMATQAFLNPSLFELRPALTYPETLALAAALLALKIPSDSPLQKLLSPPISSQTISQELIARIVQPEVSADEQASLLICSEAIAMQQNLLFSYTHAERSFKDTDRIPYERRVVPLELTQDSTGWKLKALDLEKRGSRTFFIHRMEHLRMVPPIFRDLKQTDSFSSTPDAPRVTLFFDDKKYLSLFSWYDLRVLKNTDPDDNPSASIRASVPFFKTEWLPRHILACKGHVWTDDPQLIDVLRDLSQRLLEQVR